MKTNDLKKEFWLMVRALEQVNYEVVNVSEITDNNGDFEDEVWDLPYAYVIDNFGYHIGCFVQRIESGKAFLIGLAENQGEEYECQIEELSFHTLIELAEQTEIKF